MSDKAILKRLVERKAIIKPCGSEGTQAYAAYPFGDRRRRRIGWIDNQRLRRMLADGVIHKTNKGYEIASSASRRVQSQKANSHSAQHRVMETQATTDALGRFRPTHVNRNAKSVLRRLGRVKDHAGELFLSAAEIEVGERLGADYARSLHRLSVTQNFENVSSASHANSAEEATAAVIDARHRYQAALSYVGPGLTSAVNAICCKHMGLEEMELAEGRAKRSGKTVLKLGLQRLAEFYGTHVGQRGAG